MNVETRTTLNVVEEWLTFPEKEEENAILRKILARSVSISFGTKTHICTQSIGNPDLNSVRCSESSSRIVLDKSQDIVRPRLILYLSLVPLLHNFTTMRADFIQRWVIGVNYTPEGRKEKRRRNVKGTESIWEMFEAENVTFIPLPPCEKKKKHREIDNKVQQKQVVNHFTAVFFQLSSAFMKHKYDRSTNVAWIENLIRIFSQPGSELAKEEKEEKKEKKKKKRKVYQRGVLLLSKTLRLLLEYLDLYLSSHCVLMIDVMERASSSWTLVGGKVKHRWWRAAQGATMSGPKALRDHSLWYARKCFLREIFTTKVAGLGNICHRNNLGLSLINITIFFNNIRNKPELFRWHTLLNPTTLLSIIKYFPTSLLQMRKRTFRICRAECLTSWPGRLPDKLDASGPPLLAVLARIGLTKVQRETKKKRPERSITTLSAVNHERDTDPWSNGDPLEHLQCYFELQQKPSIDAGTQMYDISHHFNRELNFEIKIFAWEEAWEELYFSFERNKLTPNLDQQEHFRFKIEKLVHCVVAYLTEGERKRARIQKQMGSQLDTRHAGARVVFETLKLKWMVRGNEEAEKFVPQDVLKRISQNSYVETLGEVTSTNPVVLALKPPSHHKTRSFSTYGVLKSVHEARRSSLISLNYKISMYLNFFATEIRIGKGTNVMMGGQVTEVVKDAVEGISVEICLRKHSFTNFTKGPAHDGDMSNYVYSFARPTRYTDRKKNGNLFSASRLSAVFDIGELFQKANTDKLCILVLQRPTIVPLKPSDTLPHRSKIHKMKTFRGLLL
ncbi:hypothetical protein WN51_13910 [Melipona quadrifasciata]|uniref:Uncharacterized protein n=1 Tax=Melipona quadrifasciata TaxID=166423 RepID=A0A0N0U4Z3_9HYME|nr:hypothetical protein WN51_13910 [Melipona quadrifasciata]